MTWTDTVPTAPGTWLWRAKGDAMNRWRLLEIGRSDGMLRVSDQQAVATDGRYLVHRTPASLRGEWIGPVPQ